MRPPEVGQVLVTSSGQKFFVTEVSLFSELDEPDIDPDGFLVSYVLNRADIVDMSAMAIELDHVEFEELCKREGIRY